MFFVKERSAVAAWLGVPMHGRPDSDARQEAKSAHGQTGSFARFEFVYACKKTNHLNVAFYL